MSTKARFMSIMLVLAAIFAGSGCNDGGQNSGRAQFMPLFGDGSKDNTAVLARVDEVEITDMDLDLFLDELPPAKRSKFNGPDGRRLALKKMVDEAVLALGAVDEELFRDQDVARTLISLRRNTLDTAMRNYGLLRGHEPTEEEIRAYFQNNPDKYRQLGIVEARGVETMSEEKAQEAYQRLLKGGKNNDFPSIVKEYSTNIDIKDKQGDLGWFNKGGFVPFIRNSNAFSAKAYDLKNGLNPPFKVSDRWHVVEILRRNPARPMTFAEARDKVSQDMLPAYQDGIIKDYLLAARKTYNVEMFGEYAPGRGMTVDEIFARARALPDAEAKLDLYTLIHTDYPKSDKADDALFLSANVAIETWEDVKIAERYLTMLINEYPDSDLIDDATYLRDNLHNPKVIRPMVIDDLKKH